MKRNSFSVAVLSLSAWGSLAIGLGAGVQCSVGPVGLATFGLALCALCAVLADWRGCIRPLPNTILAFLLAAVISLLVSGVQPHGVKELVQWAVLFGGSWIACSGWQEIHDRFLTRGLTVALVANLLVAMWQRVSPESSAALVAHLYGQSYATGGVGPNLGVEMTCGLMRSHLQYAAFVTVVFPCLAARYSIFRSRRSQACFWGSLVVASMTIRSAPFLILLALGVWLTVRTRFDGIRPGFSRLVLGVGLLIIVGFSALPVNHASSHAIWDYLQPYTDEPGVQREPKRVLVEWAAVVHAVPRRLLGSGPGSYLTAIRRARQEAGLPKPSQNRVRRDGNSQYQILLVEVGLAATICLLAAFLGGVFDALLTVRQGGHKDQLAASCLPLLFFILLGFFTLFLAKGLGPLACLLLFLPRNRRKTIAFSRRLVALVVQVLITGLVVGVGSWVGAKCSTRRSRAAQAVRTAHSGSAFFVEAEEAAFISPEFLVRPAHHSGKNSVLTLPAGTGKKKGVAKYRIQVPEAGRYRVWLRVYWEGGCANSVLCQINDGRTFSVEDAIFGRWHWVDAVGLKDLKLAQGGMDFVLKGSEDGVHIDQIAFVSGDEGGIPVGIMSSADPAAELPKIEQEESPAAELKLLDLDAEGGPREEEFDKYGGEEE